ncbi:MAG: beta strand repeat-containing protein, partial [Dolichospermum sp.]
MKPIFVIALYVISFFAKGQTILINPTGEGGFENGGTFAANNWTVVNTGTANGSQWFVTTSDLTNGSYSFVRTGSNAAYISNNSGVNWRYNTTPASTSSHLYKDVTFPSGETAISLTFRYNVNGESSWDEMYVYLCPQTLTPVANSPISSSTSVTWTGSGTATLLGTFRLLSAGTGATGNISISGATAGNISANSNMRLVFTWKNDGSGGAEPPAAIDDISLTSAVPVPVSGIKTIGPSGDFTTLGAAVNYLVANGINGATTLELQTTYTSASESYPITLGAVSGASIANTITIVPNVGATALNISGSSATALIDINGGDYWRIDGRPGGSGSAKELTLSNTNTSGVTIRYIADATNNIIRNCIVQGVNTSSSGAVISFSSGTTTGNDDNTIQNCDIRDGASTPNNGIYSFGTSTAISNDNITIQDNNIFNFFQSANSTSGININSNNNNWTVSGNSFYQTADRTYTASNQHNGIFISNSNASATFTISGNFIGGKAASCGGGAYTMLGAFTNRFVGISVSAASTATTSIQGNTIANFSTNTTSSATTSNGNFCAIWVSGGNANIGTVTGNTIGATTGTGNITVNLQTNSGGTSNLIVYSGSSTVNISNNTIGSITLTGASTTIGIGFNGIWVSGGTPTITNNTIGSTSTANSINSSTIVTGSQVQALMGIQVTSGVTNTTVITGNTIANINQAGTSTSTSSTLRGISFAGASAAYTYNISNNTIRNLSGANANTNTNMLTSVVGIVATSGASTAGSQITNNVIYSLANTNTGSVQTTVLGIGYSTATSTNISRNKIYDLRNASTMTTATTPPVVAGIGLRSTGTNATISNNMISLGSSQSTNTEFIGIWNNFNAPGFIIHHNSVIITGTASSGALPTFAFVRGDNSATGLTTPLTFRNNIFINERSGGSGKHYALGNQGTPLVTTGWTSASSNYNILNSSNSSTLGLWGPTDYNFASWKTNTSGDNNSFNAVTVTFTDQANGDLHLNMGVSVTVLESNGDNTTNTGITSDYDGNTRPGPSGSVNGGGIAPDFGADEFDGTPLDLSPPSIGVTALSNTCSTGDRIITGVTIADVTGVPVAGVLQPRIYYRKNAGTWFSSQGSLTSGTATNGTWSFTIVATDMGGLNTTDAIQYYFIAQDVSGTPNIGSNPSSGLVASDVNTVTTSPTSPSSYTIAPVLSGTYNVGTGQTYTTLTAAVSAYNNGCLSGAVTFQLMDATYSGETLPITINNHTDASATNTLTIKPASGVTSSLSGSSSSAIITLNGADYVTIDGSNNGSTSRNFTIANTNTGTSSAVVWIQTASSGSGTSATNNNVKNCVITGNSNTTTLFGIGSGSSTISTSSLGTSNNNNTIQNNNISKVQHGIYSQGASATTKNTGTTISNNLLNTASPNNIATTGIRVGFEDGVSITGNEIDALQAPSSTDAVAIGLGSASVNTITFTGNEVINASVLRNKIGTVRGASTWSAIGILYTTTTNTGTSTIANNMIHDVQANGTSGDLGAGIFIGGVVGTVNVFYNSVTLRGTLTGGSHPSFGFASASSTPTLNIRNNIFSSTGSTGANLNRAMGFNYSTLTNVTSNNNDLVFSGTSSAAVQTVNLTNSGATSYSTLADWNTASSKDLNSISIAPTFTSATDLHLVNSDATNISNFYNKGAVVSVTTDFDGSTRGTINTDIGVDEFIPTTTTAWEGNTSTDWATATNWKQSSTPSSGTHIIIPGTAINQPVLSGATSIGNLTYTGSGSILSVNGNTLTLNGTISGSGFVRGSSTSAISIGGTGAFGTLNMDQTTDGTTNVLGNFTLNRTTSGTVTLGNKLVVSGVLTPTDGTLTTGGFLHLRSDATNT